MALSWCWAAVLLCGSAQALGGPALSLENEVPLRATSWLPDSQVTIIHLPKDRTRRLYFTLKKKTPMMSVTVSPCDVPIQWTLSAKTLKDKSSKSLYWSPRKSVPEVWWRAPGLEVKMHSYTGTTVETFRGAAYGPASIYILRLKSREKDTRVSLYLQEGSGPPGAFPELPPDPRVHTVGVGMSSVTLSWPPSGSVRPVGGGYQYCVLVNQKHNYRSLCAAAEGGRERQRGGRKATEGPVLKQRWWQQWDSSEEVEKEDGHPVETPAGQQCVCDGTESVCTVSELQPDTQYYFDVFVMDTRNGTSMAYTGTFARTHEEARSAVTELGESERRWVPLPGDGRQGGYLFSFHPQGYQRNALLTLQSCGAKDVRLTVSNKGHILTTQLVGPEVSQVWLQGKPTYLIHLEGGTPDAPGFTSPRPAVKLQASSAYHRQAPPSLPPTLQIKSFNRLRGCRSVTLAWLGTEERSLYCVYRRRLAEGEHAAVDRCLGPESRSDAEKVLCKYFQELNPRRAVTTATIAGLEPGASYVFDVYLMRRWGIPIKYHSKTVRTRKDCGA